MNIRRLPRLLALVASVLATVMVQGAHSQEPDPNVPVTARPRPDFDPLGIRAGGFLIYPHTTVATSYDSNVFATKNDTKDDFIFTFLPGIVVQSNFPRHAINFAVQGDIGRYVSHTREDYEDVGTALNGRLDITRDSRLIAGATFAKDHQRRDDPEDPDVAATRKPVEFYAYGGRMGFEQDLNRFNFRVLGTFDRRDYNEEEPQFNEDERDRNRFGGSVRTGYFISPRINAFLQGGVVRTQRDASQKTGRDNNVYSALVGTQIDITGLLFGEVSAGWSRQEFDESNFNSENGFTYDVALTWNPTRLTSVRLDGAGGFVPSTVGSSNLRNEIGLRVDHELLRNLLIGGEVTYRRDDFQNENRTDDTIDVGPTLTYFVNRHFQVGAGYTYTTRSSDQSSSEFDRNVITLSLTAQL